MFLSCLNGIHYSRTFYFISVDIFIIIFANKFSIVEARVGFWIYDVVCQHLIEIPRDKIVCKNY